MKSPSTDHKLFSKKKPCKNNPSKLTKKYYIKNHSSKFGMKFLTLTSTQRSVEISSHMFHAFFVPKKCMKKV